MSETYQGLLAVLKERFLAHPERHPGVVWDEVASRLRAAPDRCASLAAMEASGGEPDVVGREAGSGVVVFVDCAAESPEGRRSLCYDQVALDSRKQNKPSGSALSMASAMGCEVLDEEGYRRLQEIGAFDQKTSSWILTPEPVRKLGGALFGDRRYGRVFTYHNGADSYYGARGFRACLRV